jgi:hypothetical protein
LIVGYFVEKCTAEKAARREELVKRGSQLLNGRRLAYEVGDEDEGTGSVFLIALPLSPLKVVIVWRDTTPTPSPTFLFGERRESVRSTDPLTSLSPLSSSFSTPSLTNHQTHEQTHQSI